MAGPNYNGGYNWWKIRWEDGIEGWSAEGNGVVAWLTKKYITPSAKFSINDRVKATGLSGSNLIVRYDPPDLAYKGSVAENTEGTVIDGPFYGVPKGSSGFYHFWKVNFGSITGWSAENYLTKITTTAPSPPRNLQATAGDTVVYLNWEPPLNNGGSAVTNYKIYRGTCSGCETLYYTTSTTGTSFTNTNVVNGVTYYYKVTAVNSIGESGFSNEASATPQSSVMIPDPPTHSSPSDGSTILTLTPTFIWNSDPDADYHGLYIRNTDTNVLVFDSEINYGPIYGNSFDLPNGYLENGYNYRWNMRSYNDAGPSSFTSPWYFSTSGAQQNSTRINGIDVYGGQGTINWNSVYDAGYRFAFIKASQRDNFQDSKFRTNMDSATAAGLKVGPYHFACPEQNDAMFCFRAYTAAEEAQNFINTARDYMTAGYLRPVLDLEVGAGLGKAALSQWVRDFIDYVKSQTGVEPIIYVSSNYANNYLDTNINQYDLWIAHWSYNPNSNPNTGIWPTWDFWQYSDQGSVPGISGYVDLDVFNGNLNQLQNFVIGSSENSFNKQLSTGWNLISLPLSPQNKAVEQVFSSIDGYYAVIYAYDPYDVGNEWRSYDPNRPSFLNSLKEVNETIGMWIFMSSPSTLTINGNLNSDVIFNLKQGWNLISYPSLTEQSVTNALNSVSGDYLVVYEYVASDTGNEWKSYDPARPSFLNTLTAFKPGYGYWVWAVSNTRWRFDGAFKKI